MQKNTYTPQIVDVYYLDMHHIKLSILPNIKQNYHTTLRESAYHQKTHAFFKQPILNVIILNRITLISVGRFDVILSTTFSFIEANY